MASLRVLYMYCMCAVDSSCAFHSCNIDMYMYF